MEGQLNIQIVMLSTITKLLLMDLLKLLALSYIIYESIKIIYTMIEKYYVVFVWVW